MKSILCIAVTDSLKERLANYFFKSGYKVVYCNWNEINIHTEKILYNSNSITVFSGVILGSRYWKDEQKMLKRVDISELYLIMQSYLKTHNIPFLSFSTTNTIATKVSQILLSSIIETPFIPSEVLISQESLLKYSDSATHFILKHPDQDRGKGVAFIESKRDCIEFLQAFPEQQIWIVQKFVPNNSDFRAFTVGGGVIGIMKRTRKNEGEFRNNISLGAFGEVSSLPNSVIKDCKLIAEHMQCDVLGVDIIQDKKTQQYYLMEINTNPQYKGFEGTTGADVAKAIAECLLTRLTIKLP